MYIATYKFDVKQCSQLWDYLENVSLKVNHELIFKLNYIYKLHIYYQRQDAYIPTF